MTSTFMIAYIVRAYAKRAERIVRAVWVSAREANHGRYY